MPSSMRQASGCGRFRLLRNRSWLRKSNRSPESGVKNTETQRRSQYGFALSRSRFAGTKNGFNGRFSLCLCAFVSLCLLATALILAQQQPRGVIDQDRIREVHYDTSLWWEPGRGIALPSSKNYDNASGQLRLLNRSGDVETKGHPFFTALGSNGRACVTCHQP